MRNKSIFQIFKFGHNRQKTQLYTPTDQKTWWAHMSSEFIGTFILSLALAGLAIVMPNKQALGSYMYNQIFIGIYAGAVVLLLIMAFSRWSCDINPAVTVFRIINGTNTTKYGLAKITIQFLAGFLAGVVIWALTADDITTAIDATKNYPGIFKFGALKNNSVHLSKTAAFFWELFVESVMIVILLWAVFSKGIKDSHRELVIAFSISCALMVGFISGNSLAINPARGLAQQIPALLSGDINSSGILITTIALLLTGIAGPVLYALIQGYAISYGNDILLKAVTFKFKCNKTRCKKNNAKKGKK